MKLPIDYRTLAFSLCQASSSSPKFKDYWLISCLYYFNVLITTSYPSPYVFFNFIGVSTVLKTPLVMIPTLLHNVSASYIMWVVMNRARFVWHSASTAQSCLLFSGSKPVEGSSKNTILGSPTRLIATESLLLIPPESSLAANVLNFSSFTSLIDS